jgi:hypothetical protein
MADPLSEKRAKFGVETLRSVEPLSGECDPGPGFFRFRGRGRCSEAERKLEVGSFPLIFAPFLLLLVAWPPLPEAFAKVLAGMYDPGPGVFSPITSSCNSRLEVPPQAAFLPFVGVPERSDFCFVGDLPSSLLAAPRTAESDAPGLPPVGAGRDGIRSCARRGKGAAKRLPNPSFFVSRFQSFRFHHNKGRRAQRT